MKKSKIVPFFILTGILMCITILHACKKTGCWHCTAYDDNGQKITKQRLCSDAEEISFRAAYFNADEIKCD